MHHLSSPYAVISLIFLALTATYRLIPPLLSSGPASPIADIPPILLLSSACWITGLASMQILVLKKWRPELHESRQQQEMVHNRISKVFMVISAVFSGILELLICNMVCSYLLPSGPDAVSPFTGDSTTAATVLYIAEAAFSEELLYRLFLPGVLCCVCTHDNLKNRTAVWWCANLTSICLFAFAHRYLGWGAVLHAALAACIFTVKLYQIRSFTGRTTALIATGTIHFLYNLILCMNA